MLGAAAARNPQKPAVICGEEQLTYAELDRATTALAGWFLDQGLKPGDRVAIHWQNSFELVKVLFASWKAGLIVVPINVRFKAPEIAYILEHSGAALCFSQPHLAHMAQGCPMHSALPETGSASMPVLAEPDPDRPAAIQYTSGTTSRPKGVTHTHRTLCESARLMGLMGVDGSHTILVMTSIMHASGLICDLLPAVLGGATAVLVPAFDPALVLDLIERRRATYTVGMPIMLQFMVEEQARKPRDISSLRFILGGGDSVSTALQERFQSLFGLPLREGYGMTETLPVIFNVRSIRAGSIGHAVDGVEVRIVGLDGADVREGEIGEIIVRSPASFIGYWKNPQATADTLIDGWLYTGDLARRDAEGYFWFEGRKKQIIIRGGSNISPQEVEGALYEHPAVLEAGVIGWPDPVYGEIVVAFVALREGMHAPAEELREFARERLSDYKVPERVMFLPELPKGITGKVQRRALKDMAASA